MTDEQMVDLIREAKETPTGLLRMNTKFRSQLDLLSKYYPTLYDLCGTSILQLSKSKSIGIQGILAIENAVHAHNYNMSLGMFIIHKRVE